MSRFVFAADLHLDHHAWVDRPALCGDSRESFRQIVDYCVRERLPLVLGGDVFDKQRPDSETVEFTMRQLDRMEELLLDVFYIQGQHELDRETPWLSVHPWPIHVHKKPFKIGDIQLYGLDWLPADQLSLALQEVPAGTQMFVTHQVWSEHMGVGRIDGSVTSVPHAAMVLSGDYHVCKCSGPFTGATGQTLTLCSPGSTCMRSISEPDEKYFFIISGADSRNEGTVMPLMTRRVLRWNALPPLTLDEVLRDIDAVLNRLPPVGPDVIEKPILHIKYADPWLDAYDRIVKTVGDRGFLFLSVLPQTGDMEVDFAAMAKTGSLDSVPTAISAMLTAGPLEQGAQRLWSSNNPAETIEEMYKEFMASQP